MLLKRTAGHWLWSEYSLTYCYIREDKTKYEKGFVGQAERLGYRFSNLKDWIYELVDYYIDWVGRQ